jgi:hypothetical protein
LFSPPHILDSEIDVSEVVQERFRQLYSIPVIAVNRLTFEGMVLEFVKLIQSALVIFDLFDSAYDRDGLLCDTVVDSMQRWTLEIGEQLQELHLEVCKNTTRGFAILTPL